MINKILIRWYMKVDEILILGEVFKRHQQRRQLRDNLSLSHMSIFLIEADLGYEQNSDKFEGLYSSLIKRRLLKSDDNTGKMYLFITEKGEEYLADYEEFLKLSIPGKISQIIRRDFSPIFSLIALIVSIFSLYFSVHKG